MNSENHSNLSDIHSNDLYNKIESLKILLVEDNFINQKLFLSFLNNIGINADVAENGLEAVQLLETFNYDIVFMDIQMPVMDGIEATKIIRDKDSNVSNHDIPIIALTAYSMPGAKENLIAKGLTDYIAKPFTKDDILDMIIKILGLSNNRKKSKDDNVQKNPIFDYERALLQIGNDKFLFKEILQLFLTDTPKYIENLQNAIESNDLKTIERNAHTIKSTSGMICAKYLELEALKIEKAGKEKNLQKAEQLIDKLIKKFELVKIKILEYI